MPLTHNQRIWIHMDIRYRQTNKKQVKFVDYSLWWRRTTKTYILLNICLFFFYLYKSYHCLMSNSMTLFVWLIINSWYPFYALDTSLIFLIKIKQLIRLWLKCATVFMCHGFIQYVWTTKYMLYDHWNLDTFHNDIKE